MTDDPKDQRRRHDEEFTERGGWLKPVAPPKADAQPPGPQPKTATAPAPTPAVAADDKAAGDD